MVREDRIREVVVREDSRGWARRERGISGRLRDCGEGALEEGEDEECGEEGVGRGHDGDLEVGLPAGVRILMREVFLSRVVWCRHPSSASSSVQKAIQTPVRGPSAWGPHVFIAL